MNIVITGGHGFLGQKLCHQLLAQGLYLPSGEHRTVSSLVLSDIQPAGIPSSDDRVTSVLGDSSDTAILQQLITATTDVVFHLAAVVSGQAEQEFDVGMRINLDGTRHLLEHCRSLGTKPMVVFASSTAVYGGTLPETLTDQTTPVPQSSYGTQKLMGEMMVNDFSRKGFIDGRALRLPTVVVRPGKPNAAASSFASSIIREPMNGEAAVCPVPTETRLWITSPDRVIDNIIHSTSITADKLGDSRSIALPGISVTVQNMLDALANDVGSAARELVTLKYDPNIDNIVQTWPGNISTDRANALGFGCDTDFSSMIQQHLKIDQ